MVQIAKIFSNYFKKYDIAFYIKSVRLSVNVSAKTDTQTLL